MARKGNFTKMESLLVKRRDALRTALAGDLSSLTSQSGGDVVDMAIDLLQNELSSQLVEVESRELAGIERALDNIRRGKYGVCEACEKKIPAARLEAVPHATMCVKCQRIADEEGESSEDSAAWGRAMSDDSDDREARFEDIEVEAP